MKNFMVGLFLMSTAAYAGPLTVSIKDFNFTYTNPQGKGQAASFSRSGELSFAKEAIKVNVEKVGDDFKLSLSGAESQEFTFKDAPSFMTNAETMSVSGFNLNLSDRAAVTLGQGRFHSKEDDLKLDNLSLDCNRDVSQKEAMDQLLSGCIQKLTFKTSKYNSSSIESNMVSLVSHSIVMAALEGKGITGEVGVNNLDLSMTNGSFKLAAEVKAAMSGKVKGEGNMSYDAKTGVLTIKISNVKFGILGITGKVFDELKKNESDKMKVKEPYVYYTVK